MVKEKIQSNNWSGRLGRRNPIEAKRCVKCKTLIATVKEPPICKRCRGTGD